MTMGDELPAGQSIRQATWAVGENWIGGRASAEAIPRPPGPRKQGQSAACKCNPTERVSRQLRISPIGKDKKDIVQRGMGKFQSGHWAFHILKSNQDRKDSAPRPLVGDLPSTPRIPQKPVPSEKARFLMELNPPSALGF